MDYVGCEKQDLKERDVGSPGVCGDLAQGVIVKKFSDVLFHGGSGLVEQIHPPGMNFEVGDKDMVDVLLVFEQRQLLGRCGILCNGTPPPHKAEQLSLFKDKQYV